MLQNLSIRDFVIVQSLDLEFNNGFTTLTGETGAGKSILIDALSLSLGARNEGDVTRTGCDKAEISTRFFIRNNQAAQDWLSEQDIEQSDELILRRVIYADGRSRAFINGIASTVAQLKAIGETLIDIYSQNAHHSLLQANTQRDILDDYAENGALRIQVSTLYKAWYTLHLQRIDAEKNAAAYADELAELRDQSYELKALAFDLDEWALLQQEHHKLANSAHLLSGLETCIALLDENEPNTIAMLTQVQVKLAHLVEFDASLKEATDGVDSALIQLEEAVRALNRYLQKADVDPAKLNEVESRIQSVHQMARKCRVKPEELPALLANCIARMDILSAFSDDGALAKHEADALIAFQSAANLLSKQREVAAKALSENISQQMQRLSLNGGQFQVALNPIAASAYGLETVDFFVAGHAGVALKPLNKVASGGELSRISLALHVTTASKGSVPCMIFDEVDVGIGGGVAEVVGQLLKTLGESRQVLVITHLAQVAAQAKQHLQVSKTQENGVTLSHIQALTQTERIEEISRMIGGLEITETTRQHAKEMLALRN